ncbi:hypothetical protein NQZ79_g3504 [Umbelopsis isabellina]|nr:hypothetical protein NQZ79_g3504 [Umbelopsis isabellina]
MSMNEGCKALYVGNLDSRVTDYMLYEIFSVVGQVDNVKIIMDRNYQHGGMNYGFVEFVDHLSAEQALLAMNGRKIFTSEIRVNWAVQGATQKEDTSNHFHIFVGDLSPEVDDTILTKAFSAFGTMSDARVMWDQNTGKSRGFGFVSFREKADAEQAISTMNGEWLGSRAIRCNWANQKAAGASGGSPAQSLSYESVLAQTPPHQTTVYIGNLPHGFQQHDLAPYFQPYGYVSDIRMQAERGFAFVTLDSHENAAHAIVALNGADIGGRPARLSWGKDRAAGGGAAYGAGAYGYGGGGGGYHQASPAAWHQPQGYAQAPAAGHGQAANGQWDQYYQQYYGHQGGYQ